ncbi:MAG: HAD-IA family hydrolase [Nanoarchaeota archaeon]
MKSKKTKLIMFDYDGVLIDSNSLPKLFYDDLTAMFGTRKFESVEELREILEVNVHDSLRRIGLTTDEQIEAAMKLFGKHDERWKNLNLFPAVKEMLHELKMRGYLLAIVSNNREETIRYDLKRNSVLHYFDHIIDTKFGRKPEADQIIHCLKLANVHAEEAVMIDDMDGGIIAAKKAKLKKAIGVSYGYQLRERLHMADHIVDKPQEIMKVIE